MNVLQEVLDRLVFTAGEQDYCWADVVLAGRRWNRWQRVEADTARGASALSRLGAPIGEDELEEAGRAFRYARNLLAAEEMEAWLDQWGLGSPDWSAWLRRRIARERFPKAGATGAAGEDEVWAEAVCSGALAELARELAARAAAAEAAGVGAGSVDSHLEAMDEALREFVESALTAEERARALELRGSDWVRIAYDELQFSEAGMAREAALCVRDDGMTLAEVAQRAGVALRERRSLVEEVDATLSKTLLGAPPGELVGPLSADGRFLLIQVNEKIAPNLGDPLIQDLLNEEVPRRALEREVRNRVRWHERL